MIGNRRVESRVRPSLGKLLALASLPCAGLSLGLVGIELTGIPGRWARLSVELPERAGWAVLPALAGVGLAVVAGGLAPGGRLWRGALGVGLAAAALAGWPLALVPATEERFHSALHAVLGAAYPDGVVPPSEVGLRREALSWEDYFRGILTPDTRVFQSIPYGAVEGMDLLLDLYMPNTAGLHPLVVTIHGGGWISGTRHEQPALIRYLTSRGYAVAAVDYRLAPASPYPAAIEDVRAAVAYLAVHAAEYELDPGRVALLGRSAGGQVALLAAYTSPSEVLGGAQLRAVVAYYPVTDLAAIASYWAGFAGQEMAVRLPSYLGAPLDAAPGRYAEASPVNYADRPVPPTLVVHGARDRDVVVEQGRSLAARLAAAGNQVAYLEIPWAEHGFDTVFNGLGHQLTLYELDRFLAWALAPR